MKRILEFLAILLLSSCNQSNKVYYDTGELLSEEYIMKEYPEFSYYKSYYKSGAIKEEGMLYNANTKREAPINCIYLEDITKSVNGKWAYGNWTTYYEDGAIKENGYYHNGEMVINAEDGYFPELKRRNIHIRFEGMKKEMESNKVSVVLKERPDTIPFRIYVEDTPLELYSVNSYSKNNASITETTNDNLFSHELIVPEIPDTIFLVLQFMNENGVITASDSTSRKIYTIIVKDSPQ